MSDRNGMPGGNKMPGANGMPGMPGMNGMPDMGNMSQAELDKMMDQMRKKQEESMTPEQRRQREEEKQKNNALLDETLDLCRKGSYETKKGRVSLRLSEEELSEILVYLPDEIEALSGTKNAVQEGGGECLFSCENADALSMARRKYQDPAYAAAGSGGRLLVLNLASATRPGGAIRDGGNGQEEDLCRRTSLLLSLQSEEAKRYYAYNNGLKTHLGSDGVMITPDVAVLRDEKKVFLDEPFYISVLSCAAPNVRMGMEGKTEEEYRELLVHRIEGMLRCAASLEYKNLILGAFGCGVFGNDAAVVSDAFRSAFDALEANPFAHVDFAVLCKPGKEYNYQEFCRNFGD